MTNRKLHARFWLVPKSMTLDEPERPFHTLLQNACVCGAHHENFNEDRPISNFQLWWAVCAAHKTRPKHGPISHPQKISSKYWVLKSRVAGTAKSTTTPDHVIRSLIGSQRSGQAITHPLKKRCTARFNIGTTGFTNPHKQPPNQSRPS